MGSVSYNQISSSANGPDGGFAPVSGGLGSSMGNEFGIDQGPLNVDRQAPLSDDVPF